MKDETTGLSRQADLVHGTLLRRPHRRMDILAPALGRPQLEMDEAASGLRAEGLAARSADDGNAVRPIQPCLALSARQGTPEPSRATAPAPRVSGGRSGPVAPADGGSRRRALDGIDEASALIERLVAGVRDEVVFLVPNFLPGSFEFAPHIAEAVLRRGAALRMVWSSDLLDEPGAVEHAHWLRLRWAAPRTLPTVQGRTVLMDRTVGVVFDEVRGPHVVRSESAVDKLSRLTDRLWQNSREISDLAVDGATEITQPRHEVVLRLLAGGLTDDAVARRLGISVRTVRNDMASTMTALDAHSRFQAGVRAAQLGLI